MRVAFIKNTILIVLSASTLILDSCQKNNHAKAYNHNPSIDINDLIITDTAYWQSVNPLEFILYLKNNPDLMRAMIVAEPDSSWFEESQISELQKYVNDISPCAVVYSAYESNTHLVDNSSSIGLQVEYLLSAYAKKQYPPTLCSLHYFK